MIDLQGKIWGITSTLFRKPHFSLHLLRIKKGGYSSEHIHLRKINHFFVISGLLEILSWPSSSGAAPDKTTLKAGDSIQIRTGVWHQFSALEETLCLEVYEAAEVEEDISRRTSGGLL